MPHAQDLHHCTWRSEPMEPGDLDATPIPMTLPLSSAKSLHTVSKVFLNLKPKTSIFVWKEIQTKEIQTTEPFPRKTWPFPKLTKLCDNQNMKPQFIGNLICYLLFLLKQPIMWNVLELTQSPVDAVQTINTQSSVYLKSYKESEILLL